MDKDTQSVPSPKKSYLLKLFSGRLNRSAYYTGIPVVVGGFSLISILLAIIIQNTIALEICLPIFIIGYTFFFSSLTVRRLHDVNHNGLLVLIFIPTLIGIGMELFGAFSQTTFLTKIAENNMFVAYYYLSYFFGTYLVFRPGTKGVNKYGPPSRQWTIKEIFCLAEPSVSPEESVVKQNVLIKPMLKIMYVLAGIVLLILLLYFCLQYFTGFIEK